MKNFGIIFLIFGLLLTSCIDDSISKQEKRAEKLKAKQRKELVETPVTVIKTPVNEIVVTDPIEITEEKIVHVTYTTVSTDSSYWYVVIKDNKTNWHGVVSLATPYFDFKEAKKQFDNVKGKGYFKFIIQINKESIPNFHTYND